MNRVILIGLALTAALLTVDTATAAVYAKWAINPVVFEGEPEYPNGANPTSTGSVVAPGEGANGSTCFASPDRAPIAPQERGHADHWWVVFWRWAWALV